MPIYPYECPRGHYDEAVAPISEWNAPRRCWNCNEEMHRVVGHTATQLFPVGMWDDIDTKPIEIRSKKHLEKECRSRGIYARNYMENYSQRERLIRYGG